MLRYSTLLAVGLLVTLLSIDRVIGDAGRGGGIVVLPSVVGPVNEDEGMARLRMAYADIQSITFQVPFELEGAPISIDTGLIPVPGIGSLSGAFLTFTEEELRVVLGSGTHPVVLRIVNSNGDGLRTVIRSDSSDGMSVSVY